MKRLMVLLLCLCLGLGPGGYAACAEEETERIAIICAMENEARLLLSEAEIDRVDTVGGVEYHVGTLRGRNVVIARAGIGKALSAAGTAVMLSRYPASALIFTGIAGGVGDETQLLDMVIATELVMHDYGVMSQDGFAWTAPSTGGTGFYTCDPGLVKAAYKAAAEIAGEEHVFRGLIASGDQFISSEDYVKFLQETFGAVACEMEGASVAVVCEQFGVPFVVIRCMSDKADGNARESIENFGDLAADRSGQIVMKMLEEMDESAETDEIPAAEDAA